MARCHIFPNRAFHTNDLTLLADCVRFVPSLVEAFKGFKPGQADIVFISSDRSEELQRRYMEEGEITLLLVAGLGVFFLRD